MKNLENLTQERLKEYLHYDNGRFFVKKKRINVLKEIGEEVGYKVKDHVEFRFFKEKYGRYQLVYFWFYGYIPDMIDHINGNSMDDRIENLRPTNKSLNAANQKLYNRKSKSGIKGVRIRRNKISAVIGNASNRIFLGNFKTIEEAKEAYLKKAIELYGEHARIK